jgi:uncharacterized protein YggE
MKKLWFLLIAVYPLVSYGQLPEKGITVTGTATTHVAPDEATFSLTINTTDSIMSRAKKVNDEKTAKILDAVKTEGINDGDIKTTFNFFNETYDYNTKSDNRKKVYQSSIQLSFVLKDLAKYDEVAYKLIDLGVSNTNTIFGYSKEGTVKEQLRGEAIKDADQKAHAFAKASGVHMGKIFQIVDQESSNTFLGGFFKADAMEYPPQTTNTAVKGQIEISASVRVSYSIMP